MNDPNDADWVPSQNSIATSSGSSLPSLQTADINSEFIMYFYSFFILLILKLFSAIFPFATAEKAYEMGKCRKGSEFSQMKMLR